MKVLLVNKFHYVAGGAERYVQLWTEVLEARGHTVIHFAMDHPRNRPSPYAKYFARRTDFVEKAGPLRRAADALSAVYSVDALRRLRALIRDTRPDIAHVHSYCYQLTGSILPECHRAGVPVVQTAHEYHHVCPNQRLYNQRTDSLCELCRGRLTLWPVLTQCLKGSFAAGAAAEVSFAVDRVMGFSRRGIDRIVAPSRFLRGRLIDGGWPAHRVVHVPNFVRLGQFDATRPPGDYLLFAGRLVRHKGVMTLIRGVRRVPNARLIIAGEGPLAHEVRSAAAASAGRIEAVGYRDGDALRRLIERSRAVVVPSEWYENCPYAVLEAMAAGRAVVATDLGGHPELVQDGRTGLLYPAGDTAALVEIIRLLCQDSTLAAALGGTARRVAESRYGADRHYQTLTDLFESLT